MFKNTDPYKSTSFFSVCLIHSLEQEGRKGEKIRTKGTEDFNLLHLNSVKVFCKKEIMSRKIKTREKKRINKQGIINQDIGLPGIPGSFVEQICALH